MPYSVATLRVVAIDAAGNESESSALEVSSRAPPAPEPPVDVGVEEPPVEPTPDEGDSEGVDVPLPSTPDEARSAEVTERTVLTHGSEGGCQVSRGSAGEGARLWWLLLLFGFVGRRGYLLLGSAR